MASLLPTILEVLPKATFVGVKAKWLDNGLPKLNQPNGITVTAIVARGTFNTIIHPICCVAIVRW